MVKIRGLAHSDAEICDGIIAGLPDWFGNQDGIRQCAEAVRTERGLVAEDDAHVVGFLTYASAREEAEITWMAVAADLRGTGIGSSLIEVLVTRLKAADVGRLLVKTLSDREDPRTRVRADPCVLPRDGVRSRSRAVHLGTGEPGATPDEDPLTGG